MKLILQLGIVFFICLAGEAISAVLPFAVPTSVISMILLFILLITRVIKARHIDPVAPFLLKNMAFFFIPSAVAVMAQFEILKEYIIPFLIICAATTVITFVATAFSVRAVIFLQEKARGGEKR